MSRPDIRALAVLIVLLGVVVWFAFAKREAFVLPYTEPRASTLPAEGMQALLPLRPFDELDPRRIALGGALFRDTRLSGDLKIACISCHDLQRGGADGRRFAVGIGGAIGGINAPSVFNTGYSRVQFWDGRADTLETQAAGPIHNPLEMGSSWAQVIQRLQNDQELVQRFSDIYPDGVTPQSIVDAIATYERSLVTLNSRFDRYLNGEKRILAGVEIEGLRLFREYGCASCHQGMLLGGNMFQKFGIMSDYFAGRMVTKEDLGRFNVTQREADRHVFKVPSLRNIELTAPYFHDGSAETLDAAVTIMGRYQLGRDLSVPDVHAIVAFLKTLTGQLPDPVTP